MISTSSAYSVVAGENTPEARNMVAYVEQTVKPYYRQAITEDQDRPTLGASIIWLSQSSHSGLSDVEKKTLSTDYFGRMGIGSILHLSSSYKTENIYLSLAVCGFVCRTRRKALVVSSSDITRELVNSTLDESKHLRNIRLAPSLFITGALGNYPTLSKYSGGFAEMARDRISRGRPTIYLDLLPVAVVNAVKANKIDMAKESLRQAILSSSLGSVMGGRLLWGTETYLSLSIISQEEHQAWQASQ